MINTLLRTENCSIMCALEPNSCRPVNPQVPGSSPGRGAKRHKSSSDFMTSQSVRNFSFSPQFLFLWLAFFSISSFAAVDFEASIGRSSGTNNKAYSLGLTGLVNDHLRWRAGYASLGTPSYDTLASPSAAADDIAAGEGPGPYYWTASKQDQELYATLAPEFHSGKWIFSVEGGLSFYKPIRHQDISVGATGENASWSPTIGPILGASIGYGKTSFVFSVQQMQVVGDNDNNFFKTRISTISLRQRF